LVVTELVNAAGHRTDEGRRREPPAQAGATAGPPGAGPEGSAAAAFSSPR